MRTYSAFAAATVIAAGLVTTFTGVASAAGSCASVANAVAGVQVETVRGKDWVCRGKGGQVNYTGDGAVTACWGKDGYRPQLYNGTKKIACPARGKEVKNWTGFKVVKA
ncbi:hypothetical protein [Allokutzneria albata]|uniref:Secreted protein n=1 Tax=Allokutzneria albata TaxID=211114 RepID=A0A1G9TII7_ALLAB|nr:hypothetical protein [Allokutzneria albata]SDM47442.1 hypothetical protein SAMN04489726_1807 [Allokutzneria albata]